MDEKIWGMTDKGFTRPQLYKIFDYKQKQFEEALGVKVPWTPDTVLGIILSLASISDDVLWAEIENVYFAMYPNSASGSNLDKALSFCNLKRKTESKTTIPINCYGDIGTIIKKGQQVRCTTDNRIYENSDSDDVLNLGNMVEVTIDILDIKDDKSYAVTLGKISWTYQSGVKATKDSIIIGLVKTIKDNNYTIKKSTQGEYLEIIKNNSDFGTPIDVSSNMKILKIASPVIFECIESGGIMPAADKITEIIGNPPGLERVNNKDNTPSIGRFKRFESGHL